ncbi:hypothetical protein Ahy_B01g052118 [Arachis hypogaea]|uniref:MULE transposase domain-containing protein n=1 Tax=Arachis hypogaea TaxID=3818 RepID=A0A445ANK9_ARAHY|nr:hypothetical protein Ahy_B01g052118 [Arachis hypogaea]
MDDSTSDCQLNPGEVDYEFESNEVPEGSADVSEQEDAKEFGKYLLRMKEKNQNFFFVLELEEDQSIKLAFWADARSRAAFEYFGDVISFDTTYNTNRYNLVCGSFVEVNHHNQSTLLGCSLMKNEEIESFKWLFQCWLRCMGGNAPKGFLTDQCASMKRALQACMPTTIHRWCIWHIMKKIPSKLNGYKGHADIEQEMSQVVWNSHSKDSFDRNWNDFLLNFGLVDNKWLSDLYEDHHIWVPIYLDHHFWAGMRSTQRSESMHSFFNKFIIRNSSLIQFVKQYDNCLGSREQAERESDAADFHTVIPKVKRRHTHTSRAATTSHCWSQVCEFASESEELTAILHRAYNNIMAEMESLKAKRKGTCSLSHEDANLESVNELQSPPRIRTRGRPKNRLGSKLDKQIANATKKKKTSFKRGKSNINLFDAASVVHSNSSQYQGHVMNYQFRVPAAGDNSLGV